MGSIRSRIVNRVRTLAVLVGVSAVTALGGGASAQPGGGFGMGGMGRLTEPDVSSREIESYAGVLGLSDDQNALAIELLAAYQQEFAAFSSEVRSYMEEVRREAEETGDRSVWMEMRPKLEEFGERREALSAKFMEDLRLVLTPEQEKLWPKIERQRRRDRTLGRGGLVSGETVDLIRLLNDAKLPEEARAELRPVIEQYENDLDRALVARNETYQANMAKAMDLWRDQDFEAMDKLYGEARDAAVKLRDINRRYARQIESALAEEHRAAFSRSFQEASFPQVYRRSGVANAVRTVGEFTDLTPEQQTQLTTIRESYEREVAGANDRLAAAIEESEMNRTAQQMFGWRGRDEGSREAREAKRDIERRTMEQIRAMLTEEQRARLPDRRNMEDEEDGRPRGPGGGQRGGRRGGGTV